MTAVAAGAPADRATGQRMSLLLLAGFAVALGLRVLVGGHQVRTSPAAGLVFAACLAALCAGAGVRLGPATRPVIAGLVGAAVLCVPSVLGRLAGAQPHRPAGLYLSWALVVTVVAVAEEMFLRGALFDAVSRWSGPTAAALVGAICFAALHVPLYGWRAVPLDLAVGGWLAALRIYTGSPTAPAIAHVTADLAGWWLR